MGVYQFPPRKTQKSIKISQSQKIERQYAANLLKSNKCKELQLVFIYFLKKLHLNSKMQNALWNWEKDKVTKLVSSAQSGITLSGLVPILQLKN